MSSSWIGGMRRWMDRGKIDTCKYGINMSSWEREPKKKSRENVWEISEGKIGSPDNPL